MKIIEIHALHIRVKICIRTLRRSCEHCCFCGAFLDILTSIAHTEIPYIALIAKFGFLCGALSVYLIHFEEHLVA
jgi:hypothetical protein